jgi:diguanylate cyclase (GGDEF)-like protein
MVLGDKVLGNGIAIAERIRHAIEAAGIPHERSRTGVVTASIGVSAGIPGPGLGQHDFLAAADAALYAAKRAGRNRVWPPIPAAGRQISTEPADRPMARAG